MTEEGRRVSDGMVTQVATGRFGGGAPAVGYEQDLALDLLDARSEIERLRVVVEAAREMRDKLHDDYDTIDADWATREELALFAALAALDDLSIRDVGRRVVAEDREALEILADGEQS